MIKEKTRVPNHSAEIGRLIIQQKDYRGNSEIFERFNLLIGGLRSLPHATYAARLNLCRDIPRVRRELAELGIQV